MTELDDKRSGLIQVITAPLGFFALSLLVVEGFLTIALTLSDLSEQHKYNGMMIGAGLFIFVVICVFVLVWLKPTALTFSEQSHLKQIREAKVWGTSEQPESKKDAIESENPVAPQEASTPK